MDNRKLQSILALSATLVIGFASGFTARGLLPATGEPAKEIPSVALNPAPTTLPVTPYWHQFVYPASAFIHWHHVFDDLFNETLDPIAFSRPFTHFASVLNTGSQPQIELKETGSKLEVRIVAPGIKPDDVSIYTEGNQLVVKGHHKQESANGYSEESFVRTMDVPYAIDVSKVEKRISNGILTVTVPRSLLSSTDLPI